MVVIVYRSFVTAIDLAGLQIDVALRKFQSYFRMPVSLNKHVSLLYIRDELDYVCMYIDDKK